MPASYPTSAKAFTTKADGPGNTILAAHINDLQNEVTAVETDLISGLPVARGGTGQTATGTSGQVLTSNGAGASTWEDAAIAVVQTTTATGAQANFDLNARVTTLRCTGAAPVFSGFTVNGSAPQDGDQVTVLCLGTSAQVTTEGGGSTDVHRATCESANGQIVGLLGSITLRYDGTTDRWRQIGVAPGAWLTMAYAAGSFTGNGSMTWGVDDADEVVTYVQRGRALVFSFVVTASDVAGVADSTLRIALPTGFVATVSIVEASLFYDDAGGGGANGIVSVAASGTVLALNKINSANWTLTSGDNTSCRGQIEIQVN